MTDEERADLSNCLARLEAAKASRADPIPEVQRQHDEDECEDCGRARRRQWPPSLCCDAGYRDREACREAWRNEDSRREAVLDHALADVAGYVPLLLSALAAVRAEERERCARIAETQYRRDADGKYERSDHYGYVRAGVEKDIAAAIRALGKDGAS